MHNLIDFLTENNIRYCTEVSLKNISTFKIGGIADIVCYPKTTNDVADIVKFCKNNAVEYLTFGKCSNVVFSDSGIKKLIIKTDDIDDIAFSDELFEFGAGVMLAKASKYTIDSGYQGMEFAYGIPGSVGGAVYMNAGAYGGEMSNCVVKTEYVDDCGEVCYIQGKEHDFSPRHSFFSDKNVIITKTYIKLEQGNSNESMALVDQFQTARKTKQPLEYPSAGSVFKRPQGYFAGKLIEDCDLKGFSIGGAMVSTKHSGFIINYNKASSDDVVNLVNHIKNTVLEKFGVELECEIKFIN